MPGYMKDKSKDSKEPKGNIYDKLMSKMPDSMPEDESEEMLIVKKKKASKDKSYA